MSRSGASHGPMRGLLPTSRRRSRLESQADPTSEEGNPCCSQCQELARSSDRDLERRGGSSPPRILRTRLAVPLRNSRATPRSRGSGCRELRGSPQSRPPRSCDHVPPPAFSSEVEQSPGNVKPELLNPSDLRQVLWSELAYGCRDLREAGRRE